jgi:hypothetical protein
MTAFEDWGWRQGSVLAGDLALALIPSLEDDQVVVIVSQDCDLTHDSLDVEPTFEVLVARPVAAARPEFEHGKSPRRLHIPVGERWFECSMQQRHVLPRAELLNHTPSAQIVVAGRERRLLAKWMGLRYARRAFPTEFNDRVQARRKRVERAKKACSMLSGIFLHLEHQELPPEEPYQIILVGLIPSVGDASNPDQARRTQAEEKLDQLRQALNACPGIEVVDHSLKSHREMTVHDLDLLDRWDMDYLSDREDPGGAVAPRI